MRILPACTLLLSVVEIASACLCEGNRTACAEFWQYQSGAVFTGTVARISTQEQPAMGTAGAGKTEGTGEPAAARSRAGTRAGASDDRQSDPGGPKATFRKRVVLLDVDRAYAGVSGKQIEVVTGFGGGDCGFEFKTGDRYLVYAWRNPQNGTLDANICSPTKHIDDAREDLAYLDNLERQPKTGRIFGEVADPWKDGDNGLAGTKIELIGESDTRSVLTDSQGKFDASGLIPGKYRVHVEVPGYLSRDPQVEVHERGCAEARLWLNVDGRISGRVFDTEGRPVPLLHVELLRSEDQFQAIQTADTDREGSYEFRGVRSGKYVIAVNANGQPRAEQPYASTFYPDVHQLTQSALVSLGTAEQRQGLNLHLGPQLKQQEFRGTVFYPDGTAAGKANVVYEPINFKAGTMIPAGPNGRFAFSGYEGSVYRVSATAFVNGGYFQSDPVETAGDSDLKVAMKLIRQMGPGVGYSRPNQVQDPKSLKIQP